MNLLAELKRRNVIRMAGLYLVGAWLITQVVSTVFPAFGLSAWALRGVIVLLAIGFVPTLIFAWVFELTPGGLKRDAEVDPAESIAPQTAQRMNRTIVAVLLLALAYFGVDKFVLAPAREAALVTRVQKQDAARTVAKSTISANDKSIAVLPFVDMSQARDQEYFSDGLSEELLNQLAQIPQLRVIARTSSFSFKGKEVDVATIAKALDVAHVLEGSVRKSGNQLRITAQLVRASDSSHLWSQTYDRELSDIFKVQEEISNEVVAALKVKLLPNQHVTNTQRTSNTEAYEQYLLGMEALRDGGHDTSKRALVALERAVALDPQYANAYAGLARAQHSVANYADSQARRAEMIKKAFATVEKAIALAPDLPDGYAVRGALRNRLNWNRQGAGADFKRALALDPNNALTLITYAHALFFDGRREDAITMDRKAITIDPLSPEAWAGLGFHLAVDDQVAEARLALQRALDIVPTASWSNFYMGYFDLREGKTDSALTWFRRAPVPIQLTGTAIAEHTRGNTQASQQALDELKTKYAVGFAFQIAQVHAWRGEKDQAFQWLNRAYDNHDAGMVRLRYDPVLASLHDDPRFAALVKKMGFPE